MRLPGIEPGLVAWEATVIPLDHNRTGERCFIRNFCTRELKATCYFLYMLCVAVYLYEGDPIVYNNYDLSGLSTYWVLYQTLISFMRSNPEQ